MAGNAKIKPMKTPVDYCECKIFNHVAPSESLHYKLKSCIILKIMKDAFKFGINEDDID